jgi:hypothetical protein
MPITRDEKVRARLDGALEDSIVSLIVGGRSCATASRSAPPG